MQVTLNLKGDVSRLHLVPGDIVAIRLAGSYADVDSMQSIAIRLRRLLQDAGHNNQVIVSDRRMEILVITPDP